MKQFVIINSLLILAILFFGCEKNNLTEPEFKTMTDIDGNTYQTVKIGSQEWMAENLKVTHYRDGTPINHVTDNSQWASLSTGAYCAYNNSESTSDTYGYLYNWYVVDPNNPKKIASEGWRVPLDEDWDVLKDYLIANDGNWDGSTDDNKIGKSLASNSGEWRSSDTAGHVGNDQSSNNSSGFSALPHGLRRPVGIFPNLGISGGFWLASEYNTNRAWGRHLRYNGSAVYRGTAEKQEGRSVRLVRD